MRAPWSCTRDVRIANVPTKRLTFPQVDDDPDPLTRDGAPDIFVQKLLREMMILQDLVSMVELPMKKGLNVNWLVRTPVRSSRRCSWCPATSIVLELTLARMVMLHLRGKIGLPHSKKSCLSHLGFSNRASRETRRMHGRSCRMSTVSTHTLARASLAWRCRGALG